MPAPETHELAMGQALFVLEPQFRERVWGGQRLQASNPPVGEAWIAHGASRVLGGRHEGRTLDELVVVYGHELLGSAAGVRDGLRFPVLAKLLDCADWLSVQVHPNDEQARRMAGPDQLGKTEAWYFIETDPGAKILLGVKPGTGKDDLARAIRAGRAEDVASQIEVRGGEAVLIPAGTLHALGPGLFLYELQEASDITYRAYDWGRPQSADRRLHIEESVEVALPVGPLDRTSPSVSAQTGTCNAIACEYFEVDLVRVASEPLQADTEGRTFHILTVVQGAVELTCGRETARLQRFETALVAGAVGAYSVASLDAPATLLRAELPG
ncbi:MAG TPA: type I phosphomannose isomerase catalytic subunit [Candidatus Limnocylindrales bacterium]